MRSLWVFSMAFLLLAGSAVLAQEKASVQSSGDKAEQTLQAEKAKKIGEIRQVTIRQNQVRAQKQNRKGLQLERSGNKTEKVTKVQQANQQAQKTSSSKKVVKKKKHND